jgi:hypothetical protein
MKARDMLPYYGTAIPCGLGASNASLYEKLNFNFIRDIAPVAGVARGPQVS